MLNFNLIIPARRSRKRKPSTGRVFRMFKRLDDGSFLIAGFVNRYHREASKR